MQTIDQLRNVFNRKTMSKNVVKRNDRARERKRENIENMKITSAMLLSDGAAMNTTYGVNSAVRKIFNACGSTSRIAIFPSL